MNVILLLVTEFRSPSKPQPVLVCMWTCQAAFSPLLRLSIIHIYAHVFPGAAFLISTSSYLACGSEKYVYVSTIK